MASPCTRADGNNSAVGFYHRPCPCLRALIMASSCSPQPADRSAVQCSAVQLFLFLVGVVGFVAFAFRFAGICYFIIEQYLLNKNKNTTILIFFKKNRSIQNLNCCYRKESLHGAPLAGPVSSGPGPAVHPQGAGLSFPDDDAAAARWWWWWWPSCYVPVSIWVSVLSIHFLACQNSSQICLHSSIG